MFFVSNDRTGTATVTGSTISGNPSAGFETAGLPGLVLPRRPPAVDQLTTQAGCSSSNVSEIELMQ